MTTGTRRSCPSTATHQPVIIALAFYIVQWNVGMLLKILAVVFGSLLVTYGMIEVFVRPFKPMRVLFGMKPRGGRQKLTA